MNWHLVDGVPPIEIQRLIAVARRRHFSKGEVVFHRDDPADSLHLVSKGRFVIRIVTPVGDSAAIGVRGPGDSFGELALATEGWRRSATVTALEDAETLAVYVGDFERLRREYPSVDRALVGFLAGELRRQNERLMEALFVSAEKRVRRRLLEVSALYGGDGVAVPLTQEQLAEMAGTSRKTVNRVLRHEEVRGTLALERGRISLLDPAGIERRGK